MTALRDERSYKMTEQNNIDRSELIKNMTDNLPMLRKRVGLTQEELAQKIGVSRGTIAAIENKRREMTWNTFLSLMLLFIKNENTNKLLNVLDIYTEDFNSFIR